MNTQYEKNSLYIAKANFRMKRRERKLKGDLALFFTALGGVCAALYIIISSLPY